MRRDMTTRLSLEHLEDRLCPIAFPPHTTTTIASSITDPTNLTIYDQYNNPATVKAGDPILVFARLTSKQVGENGLSDNQRNAFQVSTAGYPGDPNNSLDVFGGPTSQYGRIFHGGFVAVQDGQKLSGRFLIPNDPAGISKYAQVIAFDKKGQDVFKYSFDQKDSFSQLSAQLYDRSDEWNAIAENLGMVFDAGVPAESQANFNAVLFFAVYQAALYSVLADKCAVAVLDPPDSNYTQIAQPSNLTPPTLGAKNGVVTNAEASSINALFQDEAHAAELADVAATSFNRSSGAAATGDIYWQNQQGEAGNRDTLQLGDLLKADANLQNNVRSAFQQDPNYQDVPFSLNNVNGYETQVQQHGGLPAYMNQALSNLGVDDATIADISQVSVVQTVYPGDPTDSSGQMNDANVEGNFTQAGQAAAQGAQGLPQHWLAMDVAAGPGSDSQLAWISPNNAFDLWRITGSGTTSSPTYGPFNGWAVRSTATGGDGVTRLLWDHVGGAIDLWLVADDGSAVSSPVMGPFPGWAAQDVAVGSDNQTRILWTNTNGQMVLWTVNYQWNVSASPVYGPFSGWSVRSLSTGSDGLLRVVWSNTNGAAALWLLNADGSYAGSAVFGPIASWHVQDVSVGSDNQARLLWVSTTGQTVIWAVDNSFNVASGPVVGPYAGWQAVALEARPDGQIDLLWDNSDGHVALWVLNSNGSFSSATVYGPF